MVSSQNNISPAVPSPRSAGQVYRLQFGCLVAAGIMELLFIISGGLFFNWFVYYLIETYFLIPGLLFLSAALSQYQDLSLQSRRQLFLCIGAVIWFVIVQLFHRFTESDARSIGMFMGVYLLALPFASATGDGTRQKGLTMISWMFIAGSMVLVLYCAMLKLNILPAFLASYVYWDGARLNAVWHPNMAAGIFMIGILLCLGFFFRAKPVWQKCLLLAAAAVQFLSLSLTHSRTSTLLTCALVAAVVFFAVWKGGWKRFLAAGVIALAVFCGLYLSAVNLYDAHNDQLVFQYSQQAADSGASADLQLSSDGYLQGSATSSQDSLSNNLSNLNGRVAIWKAAISALRWDSSIRLFGTLYIPETLQAHGSVAITSVHNAWLEVALHLGLPGLLLALVLTVYAVVNALTVLWKRKDMWQVCIALLTLGLLGVSLLESFLFTADDVGHFFSFLFLLLLGYLSQWRASGQDEISPDAS